MQVTEELQPCLCSSHRPIIITPPCRCCYRPTLLPPVAASHRCCTQTLSLTSFIAHPHCCQAPSLQPPLATINHHHCCCHCHHHCCCPCQHQRCHPTILCQLSSTVPVTADAGHRPLLFSMSSNDNRVQLVVPWEAPSHPPLPGTDASTPGAGKKHPGGRQSGRLSRLLVGRPMGRRGSLTFLAHCVRR